MKLVKLFKSNTMGKDRLLRVLLMLQLTVTIMVTMNLSESLDRYMGASGSVRVGRYLYEKNYDIYSDLKELEPDSRSEEAVLEAGKELDELLKKLSEFPVNTYFYVSGAIGDGDFTDYCVYMSMKESLPYPLESGSYDRITDKGIFLGDGCSVYIENDSVKVFGENLPVIGIIAGYGFDKNEHIAVKYAELSEDAKIRVRSTVLKYMTEKYVISARLCIGSDRRPVDAYTAELEELIDSFPHMSAMEAHDSIEKNDSVSENYSSLKTMLVVLALALCILSGVQVVGMYISCKKKEIAIRYAFGLSEGTVFLQVLKEMAAPAAAGAVIAVFLEIIIYVVLLGYNTVSVFRYGVCALAASILLYMSMLAVAFVRVMKKGIASQLGRE